jgi:hypothetical protein
MQVAMIFATLCIALAISISEAYFVAVALQPFHLLAACLAVLLVGIIATTLMIELGVIAEFQVDESKQIASFGFALALGWFMYFVIFLICGSIGATLSVAKALIETGSFPSAEAALVVARRIGTACVVCSLIPPLIMTIATKLGFKPIDT